MAQKSDEVKKWEDSPVNRDTLDIILKHGIQAPTDAETEFHGLYLGSSATGTSSVTSFTAK